MHDSDLTSKLSGRPFTIRFAPCHRQAFVGPDQAVPRRWGEELHARQNRRQAGDQGKRDASRDHHFRSVHRQFLASGRRSGFPVLVHTLCASVPSFQTWDGSRLRTQQDWTPHESWEHSGLAVNRSDKSSQARLGWYAYQPGATSGGFACCQLSMRERASRAALSRCFRFEAV